MTGDGSGAIMRAKVVLFCTSLCLAPFSFAYAQNFPPNTITVTGSATINAAPDMVAVSVNLTAPGDTPEAASQTERDMQDRVTQAASPFAGADGDIKVSNFNVSEIATGQRPVGPDQGPPGRFRVTSRVTISLNDPAKLRGLLDAIIKTGANVTLAEQYSLKNKSAVEDKARIAAVADARRQAEILAQTQDSKIDKVLAMSSAATIGNILPNLNFINGMPSQDGQIAVTQQVVVQYEISKR
jgi:uncharacterized protein YggE